MDVQTKVEYAPSNPDLIQNIVSLLKSQGIFDQFRKECLSDVDTKAAYQNLCHRVNGQVESYLSNVIWKSDLNKNKIRNGIRRHVNDCTFVDSGITRIVDRLVNSRINTVLVPKVADIVFTHLGIEKIDLDLKTSETKDSNDTDGKCSSDAKPETSITVLEDIVAPPGTTDLPELDVNNVDNQFNGDMKDICDEKLPEESAEQNILHTECDKIKLDALDGCSNIETDDDDASSPFKSPKSHVEENIESDLAMVVSEESADCKLNVPSDTNVNFEEDKIFSDLERICGQKNVVPHDRNLSIASDIPKTPNINYETSDDSEDPQRKPSVETRQESADIILDILDTSNMDSSAEKIAADNKNKTPDATSAVKEKVTEREDVLANDKDKDRDKDTSKRKNSKHRDRKHSEHRNDKDRKHSSSRSDRDHKDRFHHDSKHHRGQSKSDRHKDKSHEERSKDHNKYSKSSSIKDEKSRSSHSHSKSESKVERKRSSSSRRDSDKDREKSRHRKDESKKSRSHCNLDDRNVRSDRTSSDRDSNGPSSSSHRGVNRSEKDRNLEKQKRSSSPSLSSASTHKNKKKADSSDTKELEEILSDNCASEADSHSDCNVTDLEIPKKPKIAKNAADIRRVMELRKQRETMQSKEGKGNASSELRKFSTEDSDEKYEANKRSSVKKYVSCELNNQIEANIESSPKNRPKIKLERIDSQYNLMDGSCHVNKNSDVGVSKNNNDYDQKEDISLPLDNDMKLNGALKNSSKFKKDLNITKSTPKNCLLVDIDDVRYLEISGSNEEFKNFVQKKISESQRVYLENFSIFLKCSEKCDEIFRRDLGAIVKRKGKPVLLPNPVRYNSVILNNDKNSSISMKISRNMDVKSECSISNDSKNDKYYQSNQSKCGTKKKTLGIKRKISNPLITNPTSKMKKTSNTENKRVSSNETARLENHFSEMDFDSTDKTAVHSKQSDLDDSSSCSKSSCVSSTSLTPIPAGIKKQNRSSLPKQNNPESKRKQFYYDEGDLYKPRPSFLASSRRSRTNLLDKSQ